MFFAMQLVLNLFVLGALTLDSQYFGVFPNLNRRIAVAMILP
jgi:hypothetical protein